MFELRDVTHESVYLSVWNDGNATVIHRVQGRQNSPLVIRVGVSLPALTATGRAFLAWLPDDEAHQVIARELATATEKDPWFGMSFEEVLAHLQAVRADGVVRGFGTVITGTDFIGLAAPIFDHEDNPAAVLTVNGHAHGFDMAVDGPNVQTLLAVCKHISQQVGTTSPQRPVAKSAREAVKPRA